MDQLLQVTIPPLHSVYLDLLVGVDPVVLASLEVEVVAAVEVGEDWSKVGEENWVVGWVDEIERGCPNFHLVLLGIELDLRREENVARCLV